MNATSLHLTELWYSYPVKTLWWTLEVSIDIVKWWESPVAHPSFTHIDIKSSPIFSLTTEQPPLLLIKFWSGGENTFKNQQALCIIQYIDWDWINRTDTTGQDRLCDTQSFVLCCGVSLRSCVRKDTLSVSDRRCYYCFFLCLLDGALRCGTLWHKNRLTHPPSLLSSARSPQSTTQSSFSKGSFNQEFQQLQTILP